MIDIENESYEVLCQEGWLTVASSTGPLVQEAMERAEKDACKADEGQAEQAWAAVVAASETVIAEIDADRLQVRNQGLLQTHT